VIVAVLDTNVLASGFVGEDKPESTPGELIRRWRSGSFILVTSQHILTELAGTFTDPYFIQRLPAVTIADALESLRIDAIVQSVTVTVSGIASHTEDDVVLATALSATADYLVTGDKELRQLGAHGGTQLLLPREFLAVLNRAIGG
jgi:putative PIN family toxin of toxin-antitoxin system